MSQHQRNKQLILDYSSALETASITGLPQVLQQYYAKDCVSNLFHPYPACHGTEQLYDTFWRPFKQSFPTFERREHILMAGECTDNVKIPEHAGCDFVAATGSYLGRMTAPWLGIPPPGSATFITIRYGEFYLIQDGKITVTFMIFDVPNLMLQCGVWKFPQVGTGTEIFIPGPRTNDGVCVCPGTPPSCPKESAKSLDLVEGMLFACKQFDQKNLESMGMEAYWHPQMLWYGPTGIGSTYGLDGFQQGHQGPFLNAFPDREGGNHKARFAEGMYVASTGWPSMYATHKGSGWLGIDATENSISMRIMDWWRRDGDSLRENWVFIDLPELLKQLGHDILPYEHRE